MANYKAHKVVATLPDQLEANALYFVRVGAGFDLFVTDNTGQIAHKLNNDPPTWSDLATFESVSKNLTATPSTLNYEDGKLKSIDYSNGISKTLNYNENGRLTSVVLSGQLPEGVETTKVFTYNETGAMASVNYE